MKNAQFTFDRSFEVRDALNLAKDLTKIGAKMPVILDFRQVQFVTQTAIDTLVLALKSISGHRIFGLGFEGIGPEQFRNLGVVC